MWDKVIGVTATTAAATSFLASAVRALAEYPNCWGVAVSVSMIASGCLVCASVIRDRL